MEVQIIFFIPAAASVLALGGFYFFSRIKAWFFAGTLFLIGSAILVHFAGEQITFTAVLFFVNFVGILSFVLFFSRKMERKLQTVSAQLKETQSFFEQKQALRNQAKNELERLSKEIHRSLSLYGVIRGLGVALSWDEMVPHIDFAIHQCLGVREYQLYLAENSGESPVSSALDRKKNFQKAISRGGKIAEPALELHSGSPKLHEKQNETYLELPVSQNNRILGFLWARIPRERMPIQKEEILAQAEELAEELGMGLQKALLFGSIEKFSRTDGLTGVFRRHVFNERLAEEFRRAKHFRTVFSLLLTDLDHFKQINDTYGHQAGDEVLRRVGEILKESVYETDFVARYGGEEFVIIFPQAEPKGVRRKAELLRARIAQEEFVFGWNRIRVSVSIGIAHFPQDGQEPSTLLNCADQRLYAAKNSGRNRVVDSSDDRC